MKGLYQKTENKNNKNNKKDLPFRPRTLFSFWSDLTILENINWEVEASYQGEYYLNKDHTLTSGAYDLWNTRFVFSLSKNQSIKVGVDNLFNKRKTKLKSDSSFFTTNERPIVSLNGEFVPSRNVWIEWSFLNF